MTKLTWNNLNIQSLPVLQEHYLKYDPYAHLNIVDLWGYKTGPAEWCKIGDTVIYKLHDYITDTEYLTLLGKKNVREALSILCANYGHMHNLTLYSVPEITHKALAEWGATIDVTEDPDNHDYIFKVASLVDFSSTRLRHKHTKYLKLIKNHPNLATRVIDHTLESECKLIYDLFMNWVDQSRGKDWEKEFRALKRTLHLEEINLICIGAFDKDRLVGFTINEPESNGYYQGHFGKADYSYPNMGLLLEHETAKYMQKHYNSKYLNLQQDLGIEGIRYYKSSLGPLKHLRKYTITIDAKKAADYASDSSI